MVSETPTDGRCNYEYSEADKYDHNSGYCESHPMDNGRCFHHGGQRENGGAPEGEDNGNHDHGAFSEHFRSDLTDDEKGALEDIVAHLQSIDDERSIAAEVAAEALMKYKRSADSRFLREARQWFSEFNLMENADNVNVEGSGIVIQTNADND